MAVMLSRRTALALPGIALIAACTPAPPAPVAPATAVPPYGATLDAAGFAAAIQLPKAVILDVRTPQEFADGHLDKAVNIDVNAADFTTRIAKLDKAVPYAVYCRSGNRSATAMDLMKKAGFTSAFHLGGGIGAWTGSGRPVVKG